MAAAQLVAREGWFRCPERASRSGLWLYAEVRRASGAIDRRRPSVIGGSEDVVTITIRCGVSTVVIDRAVFTALLDNSVASERAPYRHALERGEIRFTELIDLARKADIPYSLFFAPEQVVLSQLNRKTHLLLAGISKDAFAINARHEVQLADIELIVKDLLRKQALLKKLDRSLVANTLVHTGGGTATPIPEAARRIREALELSLVDLRANRTKQKAFAMLVSLLEAKQVLVAQSQQKFMPQLLPKTKFSGLCVRDKKVPYIFLTGGDVGDNPEPVGRRIFTLTLLTVLVATGRFSAVTYDDRSPDPIINREYEITEEMLVPATDAPSLEVSTLDDVKASADKFKVTPSALVMRARRLGLVDRSQAANYLDELAEEYRNRPKSHSKTPKLLNALRRYNGHEFSRRMVAQLDRGALSPGDFCRVVCQNRIGPQQIPEFREAL